jgi:hypothetical protein
MEVNILRNHELLSFGFTVMGAIALGAPLTAHADVAPTALASRPAANESATEAEPGVSRVAVKLGMGASTGLTNPGLDFWGTPGTALDLGLEFRLTRWLALRSDLEARSHGSLSWDLLGIKVNLPTPLVSPYASLSFSANVSNTQPSSDHLGLTGAVGLDLLFGRHFFVEAEVRARARGTQRDDLTPEHAYGTLPSVSALVSVGVAFL